MSTDTLSEGQAGTRRASWRGVATVPFLSIGGASLLVHWTKPTWQVFAAALMLSCALYSAVRVFSSRKAPVPLAGYIRIADALIAANLWSVAAVIFGADDAWALHFGILVCVLTIFVIHRGLIPIADVAEIQLSL